MSSPNPARDQAEEAYEAAVRLGIGREQFWQMIVDHGYSCWQCPKCSGDGRILRVSYDQRTGQPDGYQPMRQLCPWCCGDRCVMVEWAARWLGNIQRGEATGRIRA